MKPELMLILAIFVAFILAEIIFTKFFAKKGQVKGDGTVELIGTLMLTLITQPLIFGLALFLSSLAIPGMEDVLKSWPFWAVFGLFLQKQAKDSPERPAFKNIFHARYRQRA